MMLFDANVINHPPNKIGIYKKPIYYTFIHILIGFIAFYYHSFGILFIIYQLSQLILNKRFFIFQGKIENGNSIGHTSFKIVEFLIGILIAYTIHFYFLKNN